MECTTQTRTCAPVRTTLTFLEDPRPKSGLTWLGIGANYCCLEPPQTGNPLGDVPQLSLSTSKAPKIQSGYFVQNVHPTSSSSQFGHYHFNISHQRQLFFETDDFTTPPTDARLVPIPQPMVQDTYSLEGSSCPTSSPSPPESANSIRCYAHGCGGRTFSSIGNYRRHLREKAQRAKTFPCTVCGKVFTRSTARNLHQKSTKCLNRVLGFDVENLGEFDLAGNSCRARKTVLVANADFAI
jgi:hypothetical protein